MSTSNPIHSVSLEQAQADLSGLISRLQTEGEILITDDSLPVARLVATPKPGERKLGTLAGSVIYMAPDFDAPLEDFREYM
jgi:antitoxin (DNA-binding transcriptional repressor) of toxin-antitoxin stability system